MMGIRVSIVAVIFVVGFAGLVAGARAIGQTATPTPTYLDTGHCDLPCWQGLQPGLDAMDHFFRMARERTPYSIRTTALGEQQVAVMVELSTFGAITLADVIREYGPPDRVGCLDWTHTTLFPNAGLTTTARLYYTDGLVVVDAVRPDDALIVSPDMPVRTIRFYAPGEPLYPIGTSAPWQGFAGGRYPACRKR